MFQFIQNIIWKPRHQIIEQTPRLTLTAQCLLELQNCLTPELKKKHEGVAYLFGLTSNGTTLGVTAFTPKAHTSPSSFRICAAAMAESVRAATQLQLSIVAQVHTHPKKAYHSDGDFTGALIRYPGFSSIVLPDYGARLPSFDGADILTFDSSQTWQPVPVEKFIIMQEPKL